MPFSRLRDLTERRRLVVAGAVMVAVAVAVAAVSSWGFYRTSLAEQESWLLEVVDGKARLIGSVARFDLEHSGGGDPARAAELTVSQIQNAHFEDVGIGRTGELVLGRRAGEQIEFLLKQRYSGDQPPKPVPHQSHLAEPMRLALSGAKGTVIAADYRDVTVLAAYSPIPDLNMGLVAKIDLAEIREPLVAAALWGVVAVLVITAFGIFLAARISAPVITALEARTERLAAVSRDLAHSNQELEQFAYVASHDLKAPLRGIENLVEWLEEDLHDALPDKDRRYLDLLKGRVGRLEALLDGLLQYSRVGRVDQDVMAVETEELVRNVWELLSPPDDVRLELSGEMPRLETRRVPLELVFRNLIGNALKHHDRDDGSILVEGRREGWYIRFSVHDDGPGIPPQFHDRVFGIFQTLKPRDEVEGSGMGLALVKRTVEHYGGKVSVESNPERGRGTTFRFTWPVEMED